MFLNAFSILLDLQHLLHGNRVYLSAVCQKQAYIACSAITGWKINSISLPFMVNVVTSIICWLLVEWLEGRNPACHNLASRGYCVVGFLTCLKVKRHEDHFSRHLSDAVVFCTSAVALQFYFIFT